MKTIILVALLFIGAAVADYGVTTRTTDTSQGGCQCGGPYNAWVTQAAAGPGIYNSVDGATNCGYACGQCFTLTPYNGAGSQVVMVTNFCPDCAPNQFDIVQADGGLPFGWDNVDVDYYPGGC